MKASYQDVYTKILSNAGRWLHGRLMTKPQTTFYYIQGYFLVTRSKGFIELELPLFGKSECAAMSRLTRMAGRGKKIVLSVHSKLALGDITKSRLAS